MTHAERMKEIKQRVGAATPRNQLRMHRSGECEFCIDDCAKDMLPIAIFRHENAESECRFAFNARADIPYLVARVEDMEAALGGVYAPEIAIALAKDAEIQRLRAALGEAIEWMEHDATFCNGTLRDRLTAARDGNAHHAQGDEE